jgi:hypothetical protein
VNVAGPHSEFIDRWLRAKRIQDCSVCGDSREGYTTQDISAIFQTGDSPLAEAAVSPAVPVVPVICNNCGNTMLLHAGKLGLV